MESLQFVMNGHTSIYWKSRGLETSSRNSIDNINYGSEVNFGESFTELLVILPVVCFLIPVSLKLNPSKAEQLCKASQYEEAIEVFQTALAKGTSDPDLRAAVFSQIGNAYFYLRVSQLLQ